MRKLTAVIVFLAWAGTASAAMDVPAGKAAVVEVVLGTVSVTTDQGSHAPTAGQALDFGDRVVTGSDGRVFLRLADRAVTRLAPNTEMTLDAPGKRTGTFMTLIKGWARFLVGQRAPGVAFEVSTHNAVAAVKGTDMEVGQDGNGSHASVYSSDHHPALDFSDPATGKGVELDPGQRADYVNGLFKRLDILKQDLDREKQRYQGLPQPGKVDVGQGGQSNADNGRVTPSQAAAATAALDQAVNDAVDDLGRDLKADGAKDAGDATADQAAGRIAMDRFGVQVRMSNYVLRPAPNQVELQSFTQRASGPDIGVNYAIQNTTWNTALPQDWTQVYGLALGAPANVISLSTPSVRYYPLINLTTLGNAVGDRLVMTTLYSVPYLDPSSTLQQAFSQDLWAYADVATGSPGAGVELFYNLHSSAYASSTGSQAGDAALLTNQPLIDTSYASDSGSFSTSPSGLAGGALLGYAFSTQTTYSLTQSFHVLDTAGQLQPLPAVDAGVLGGSVFGTIFPSDFLGLDNGLVLEIGYNVPGLFTRPIDLVVPTPVFDTMDGLRLFPQLPSNSCRGAC